MAVILSDTYVYKKSTDYGKQMYKFMVAGERINTKSGEFADILFDVKRRKVSNKITNVLTSSNVVIAISPEGLSLPKAYRVFVAKDPKDNGKYKAFIDATDFIKYSNGGYVCNNIDWLISYTIAATTSFIYKMAPAKLLTDTSVITDGGDCFVRMMGYVIDRLYKTTSVQQLKKRIDYFIAMYYMVSILNREVKDERDYINIRNYAVKISGIEDKESRVVDLMIKEDDFKDIFSFTMALGRIFQLKDIKVDAVMSIWLKAFGTEAIFSMEYFPAFANTLTNAYIGGYLNNQLTIEKICANSLVQFCKSLLQIGDRVS